MVATKNNLSLFLSEGHIKQQIDIGKKRYSGNPLSRSRLLIYVAYGEIELKMFSPLNNNKEERQKRWRQNTR